MIRQIIIPENGIVTIQLPKDFIGKEIEIIAFPLPVKEQSKNSSWKNLKGKYKGKLSSLDEFMKKKQKEKEIER
ncbi:MAG: hypothetical protein H7A23_21860 [Leptospiraceae bacterium]|nr:hypothetical protein [Leptospiraceae bacterium]MCP5497208.1 hypothetical protein [Leptospiraceae bacterium]